MAEKFLGGVRPGQTDVTIAAFFRSTADNSELTGLTATDITAYYWRQGGTQTSITVSDLTAIDDAHSDGGFFETDATNMPGLYRFDVPDAAYAAGADWVVVSLKAAGAFVYVERFNISSNPADLVAIDGNPTNDNSAVLRLKQLHIVNDGSGVNGTAIHAQSTGGNGVGINALGHNIAPGLSCVGGVDGGHGLYAVGGSNSGHGFVAEGNGDGHGAMFIGWGTDKHGIRVAGGDVSGNGINITTTDGHGINVNAQGTDKNAVDVTASDGGGIVARGGGNGDGVYLLGGATGTGITIDAGPNTGNAIQVYSPNGQAMEIVSGATDAIGIYGAGAGAGIYVRGGDTGTGVSIVGGSTSGNGINITTTQGNGISVTAGGGGNSGININGDLGVGISGTQYGMVMSGSVGLAVTSGDGIAVDILGGTDGVRVVAGDAAGIGTGVRIVAGSADGDGVNINSAAGRGIDVLSDAHAMVLTSQSQIGLWVTGQQEGIYVKSNTMEAIEAASTGSNALRLRTTGNAHAVSVEGGSITGHGVHITTTDGHGVLIEPGGNQSGVSIISQDAQAISLRNESSGATVEMRNMGVGPSLDLTAEGAAGIGLRIRTVDGDAVNITAGGATRKGIFVDSAAGHGVQIQGGAGGYSGISVYGEGDGEPAVRIANTGQGEGIKVVTAQGHALHLDSSADAAGEGLLITAGRRGIMLSAGQTFPGVYIEGGITSGDGVKITTTAGHGINIAAAGGDGLRVDSSDSAGVNITAEWEGISVSGNLGNALYLRQVAATDDREVIRIRGTGVGGGIKVETADGHGINVLANGSSSSIHGINVDQQTGGSAVHLVSENRHAIQLSSSANSRSPLHIFGLNPAYPAVYIEQFGATGEGLKITTVDGDGILIDAGGTGLDINAPNSDLGITGGGVDVLVEGTCQAGTSSTQAYLDASAGQTDNEYVGSIIVFTSGNGAGHWAVIDAYFGTTRRAVFRDTVYAVPAPGNGTGYAILPGWQNPTIVGGADANVVSIGGNPVNDYTAILRLRQLDIQSPDNVAFRARGGGANPGAQFEGGETGRGLEVIGGPTSGDGAFIQSPTDGIGLRVVSSGNNPATILEGSGSGDGIELVGGATGDGVSVQGGATSGRGVSVVTTDGHGVEVASAGTGKVDILATKDVAITGITYNPDNTYNTITLADGRVITFSYAAGQLTGVTYS